MNADATMLELWTDGSCLGNPGPGGWAFVLVTYRDGTVIRTFEGSGSDPDTTNNRMELQPVIHGLRHLTTPAAVTVMSDSSYVINPLTKGWIERWEGDGWRLRTSGGKRLSDRSVKNAELWRDLMSAAATHTVTWTRVPGHAGIEYNERCHDLAIAAAEHARDAAAILQRAAQH